MTPDVSLSTTALIVGASHHDDGTPIDPAVTIPPSPINLRLSYWAADPHAARLTIGQGVEWTVARDLLRDGLHLSTGIGDVWVYPVVDGIRVRLNGRSDDVGWGHLTVEIARDIAQAFVARCYTLVPAGTEDSRIDWAAELDGLLNGERR